MECRRRFFVAFRAPLLELVCRPVFKVDIVTLT